MNRRMHGLVVLVTALVFANGCTRMTTVTKVKNAADVSLSVRRIGAPSAEPIRAGTSDINLRLSAIDVDAEGYLQREGGVLRIACKKCEGKTFTLLDGERLVARVDQGVDELRNNGRAAGRLELPYEYQVTRSTTIYPELHTPGANVEYFEQTTEPVSEIGWLLIPGGALFLVSLFVLAEDTVAGMAMFVPGLALSGFGALHLVLPSKTQRYDVKGRPIEAPRAGTTATSTTGATDRDEATDDDATDQSDASSDLEDGADPDSE